MEIQPTLGGISIHWMDFHLVVGIPSILVRFPTTWMEIQPMGLVGLDVVVVRLPHAPTNYSLQPLHQVHDHWIQWAAGDEVPAQVRLRAAQEVHV